MQDDLIPDVGKTISRNNRAIVSKKALFVFIKYNCPNVVKEDSLRFIKGNIVQVWKLVILTHLLIGTHIFQPVFVMISDLWVISCKVNQIVNPVSHCLIFQSYCVLFKSFPCIII